MVMSGLTRIQDERDPYNKLFPAIFIQVRPFLFLYHVGNLDCLIRMQVADIRRMDFLSLVDTLKR